MDCAYRGFFVTMTMKLYFPEFSYKKSGRKTETESMRKWTITFLAGALSLALPLWAASADEVRDPEPGEAEFGGERYENPKYRDMLGFYDNGPGHGTQAPDFELTPLKFYEFGIEVQDITVDNASELYKPVRLSDFQGYKPVVLIFGSYT